MTTQITAPEPSALSTPDSVAALEVGTELLRGGRLIVGLALIVGAWLLSVSARKALQFAWRAGADPERRLASIKLMFDLLLVASVLWLVLRQVSSVAPGSSTLAVVLLSLFAAVGLYPELQNLIAGVGIGASEQVQSRDLVSLGDVHGEVLRVGLTHLELRIDDGSVVFVPNRSFRAHIVKVERKRKVWPIEVQLSGSFSLEEVERLKIAAILCPYRSQHTQVSVDQRSSHRRGAEGVVVKLCCWSNAGTEQAIHYIEQLASATSSSKVGHQ